MLHHGQRQRQRQRPHLAIEADGKPQKENGTGAAQRPCHWAQGVSEIFCGGGGNRFLSEGDGRGGAVFGVSMIHCRGGGNQFMGRRICQGAAACGIGIVACEGGDNSCTCYCFGQGYGGPRGVGLLVDGEGGCRYIAVDDVIHNSALQTPGEHNYSFAQGAACGCRVNPRRDLCLAGGLGLPANGGGGNEFSCGVFGQASAYFFGRGALFVRGPENRFRGVWSRRPGPITVASRAYLTGAGEAITSANKTRTKAPRVISRSRSSIARATARPSKASRAGWRRAWTAA